LNIIHPDHSISISIRWSYIPRYQDINMFPTPRLNFSRGNIGSQGSLRPNQPISGGTFKHSVFDHQLTAPLSGDQCRRDIASFPGFNNQLQCGVPSAIHGLMVQDPGAAKCVIDLQRAKQMQMDRCR
jgi:hypothetical protein